MTRQRNFGRSCFAAVSVLLLTAVSVGGIRAYLTDRAETDNNIVIGQNETVVTEEFPEPPDVPDEGGDYVKKVRVENKRSVPCYIRTAVEFGSSETGFEISLSGLNTEKWIYISTEENEKLGGYYYYKNVVMPGECTESLFEGVSFAKDDQDAYVNQDGALDVIVYEESLQAEGASGYLEAWDAFIRK